MSEASILHRALDELGLSSVVAFTLTSNRASQRVLGGRLDSGLPSLY